MGKTFDAHDHMSEATVEILLGKCDFMHCISLFFPSIHSFTLPYNRLIKFVAAAATVVFTATAVVVVVAAAACRLQYRVSLPSFI